VRSDEGPDSASWADELGDLLRVVADSDVEELEVEHDGGRMLIRRDPAVPREGTLTPAVVSESAPTVSSSFTITSPLVGVFRRALSGDGRVEEGDDVAVGQTVGAVEAMRMLNRVQCERAGVVERLLVQDGQAVEYGQALLVVRAT